MPSYTASPVANGTNLLYNERSTTRSARVVSGFDSHLRYHIEGFCNSYTGEHRVTLKSTIQVKVARKSRAIVDSSTAKTFYMVNAIGR